MFEPRRPDASSTGRAQNVSNCAERPTRERISVSASRQSWRRIARTRRRRRRCLARGAGAGICLAPPQAGLGRGEGLARTPPLPRRRSGASSPPSFVRETRNRFRERDIRARAPHKARRLDALQEDSHLRRFRRIGRDLERAGQGCQAFSHL